MRIGILTLPFNNNYGGYLQAYALMTVLKDMGHYVELINRRHNRTWNSVENKVEFFVKELLKSIRDRHRYPLLLSYERLYNYRGTNMLRFVAKEIYPQSPPLYSKVELRNYCIGRFDAVIVGSDQVWRPVYVPDPESFFLDFVSDNILKISYAASFGIDVPEFTGSQIKYISDYFARLDAVSVREISGVDVCSKFGWKNTVEVVLDPTLLLDSGTYCSVIEKAGSHAFGMPKNSFLSYILDKGNDVAQLIETASDLLMLKPFTIMEEAKYGILPSIESWLKCIKEAPFVITDSFHGTVFCIIFNIPFSVYINKGRGAPRFKSLLGIFGLSNRIVSSKVDVSRVVNEPIDWNKVNAIWADERSKSVDFLKRSLKKN